MILEDGSVYRGTWFGSQNEALGEVVFTTAMVGYPESLTDPSYRGQILIFTNPLIGNYNVPDERIKEFGIPVHFESSRIQVGGVVISKMMRGRHHASAKTLEEWLASEGVPGIEGVDTRALVKKIRDRGVMMGAIVSELDELEEKVEGMKKKRYDIMDFINDVSPKEVLVHKHPIESGRVILVDCGVKYGILRELMRRRLSIVRIPCSWDPVEIYEEYDAKGIVLSNGPGNPEILKRVTKHVRALVEYGIPTLGICLGNHLLAIADGAEIYKLKYGHRGINKPVKDLATQRVFVTSQNHGYAIRGETLNEFRVGMINVDDGTVEGIYHPKKPIIGVQYHPEGSPGPLDSTWIFDRFVKMMGVD